MRELHITKVYIFLMVILLAGMGARCEEEAKPNILLVTLDTTRADHLECYGYRVKTMPYLCELAKKSGWIYENAFSSAPLTLPAHASILTGLDVHKHLVLDNGLFRLDKNLATVASVLKGVGYHTYAYISAAVLDRLYGLDKGFDVYNDDVRMGKREFFDYKERAASQVMDVVEEDMKDWRAPWFVWIHFYDPHDPYVPPRPFDTTYENPYDGEIAFVDLEIKRLFELLDKNNKWHLRSDWAFFIGDHGEDLGDFNEERHGILITPSTIHVPFIVFAPGKMAQRRSEPISIADFTPTILDILNLKNEKLVSSMDGINIMQSNKDRKPIYIVTMMPLFSFRWSPLIAAIDYPYMLIRGSRDELFNIATDRLLKNDLIDSEKKLLGKLSPSLNKIKRSLVKNTVPDLKNIEGADNIRSLGYVGSLSRNMPKEPFSLPDARDKVFIYKKYLDSADLVKSKRWQEALEASLDLEKKDPSNTLLLNRIATIYENLGKLKETEETLLRVKDLIPDMDYPYFQLGEFYMRYNKYDQAKKNYQIALQKNPRYVDVYSGLFQMALVEKNEKEAYSVLQTAINNKVKDVDLLLYYAIFSRNNKEYIQAGEAIDDALSLNPIDERLYIEKVNIICKIDSPLKDKCLSFFAALPFRANQIAEPWVVLAEFLSANNRHAESLFCWKEALKRPAMHDSLLTIIKEEIRKLESKNITPMPVKFY